MISVRLACFRYRTQILLSAATTAIVDLSRVGNSLEHILLSEAKMRTFEIACKCICLRAQACDTVPGGSSVCHQAESHQVSKHLKTKTHNYRGIRLPGWRSWSRRGGCGSTGMAADAAGEHV